MMLGMHGAKSRILCTGCGTPRHLYNPFTFNIAVRVNETLRMNIVLVLSFLCVCSLHFAQAIVHEPRNANKGTVEPFVVEFNPEEEDREEDSFMRRAAEEEIR